MSKIGKIYQNSIPFPHVMLENQDLDDSHLLRTTITIMAIDVASRLGPDRQQKGVETVSGDTATVCLCRMRHNASSHVWRRVYTNRTAPTSQRQTYRITGQVHSRVHTYTA